MFLMWVGSEFQAAGLATANQWSYRKTGSMGTLSSQAEIGV